MKIALQLFEAWKKHELRALSRLISMAENQDPSMLPVMAQVYALTGKARIIGLTGAPGVGKSTLVGAFIQRCRKEKQKVAVVAIDPMSPFTGGALLGDRIRLQDHFNDPDVFIRSLSTRGKLGGLSLATRETVELLDGFGFDTILVETVGVGQSEVDVRELVQVTVVTLVPEWGDSVQALKSGIIEIGDVFAIHKSDREGADRVSKDLAEALQLGSHKDIPILKTSQSDAKSLDGLFDTVMTLVAQRREKRTDSGAVTRKILRAAFEKGLDEWLTKRKAPAGNPYQTAEEFLKKNSIDKLFS